MALYDGLTEYHPKTMEPIPALAERWYINKDSTEFVFFLRKGAKFSNGDPITAKDFVYSFRRGLSPELASRNAYLSYYLKYAQPYNEDSSFVRDPRTGQFVLEREANPEAAETEHTEPAPVPSAAPAESNSGRPRLPRPQRPPPPPRRRPRPPRPKSPTRTFTSSSSRRSASLSLRTRRRGPRSSTPTRS